MPLEFRKLDEDGWQRLESGDYEMLTRQPRTAWWVDWRYPDDEALSTDDVRARLRTEAKSLGEIGLLAESPTPYSLGDSHFSDASGVSIELPRLADAPFLESRELATLDDFALGTGDVMVYFDHRVVVTSSRAGLRDGPFGAIADGYRKYAKGSVESWPAVIALLVVRQTFEPEALFRFLQVKVDARMSLGRTTDFTDREIEDLRIIHALTRFTHKFDSHLSVIERLLRHCEREFPRSQSMAGLIALLRRNLESWRTQLAALSGRLRAHHEALSEIAMAHRRALDERREALDRRRADLLERVEAVFFPLLLWGTFWGMNFSFFRDRVAVGTDGIGRVVGRDLHVFGQRIDEWWAFSGSLVLTFALYSLSRLVLKGK